MNNRVITKKAFLHFSLLIIASTIALQYIVNLKLAYHVQQPLFQMAFSSFKASFSTPGGFTVYLASFFTELYALSFVGPLISSLLLISIPVLVYLAYSRNSKQFIGLLLASIIFVLSIALLAKYNFKLSSLFVIYIAYLVYLLMLTIFHLKNTWLRVLALGIVSLCAYIILGGLGLIISNLLFFTHLLTLKTDKKQTYGTIALLVLLNLVIPYLMIHLKYELTPVMESYFNSLFFDKHYSSPLLYFILIGALIVSVALRNIKSVITTKSWTLVITTAIAVIALIALPSMANDKTEQKLIEIDYLAYHKQWNDLLNTIDNNISEDQFVNFHANRALYFSKGLLYSAFSIPQNHRIGGLLIEQAVNRKMLNITSDIYYDLGLINESRHWAHEAFTSLGPQPRILKRLVEVNIINGKFNTAQKYVGLLLKSPVNRKWAERYQALIGKPELIKNYTELYAKSKVLPKDDFFMNRHMPVQNLINLLNQSPRNKMALEYVVTYYLFEHNVAQVLNYIPYFRNYNYKRLPTLVQEALILYMFKAKKNQLPLFDYKIDNKNFKRFTEYSKLYTLHRNNDKSAKEKLDSEYMDSYWYYIHFTSPITKAKKQPRK